MSKLARERKKHWRIIRAEAKKQAILLYEPKSIKRLFYMPWRQQSVPVTFSASVIAKSSSIHYYSSNKNDDDELRGLTLMVFTMMR